jgi:hypothetical protein
MFRFGEDLVSCGENVSMRVTYSAASFMSKVSSTSADGEFLDRQLLSVDGIVVRRLREFRDVVQSTFDKCLNGTWDQRQFGINCVHENSIASRAN